MSFFLTSLNKLLNGIVPLTVMKLFQYRAKRAAESTWNASKGSWLLHRREPRHRRKNSPTFTLLLTLCHCSEGWMIEKFRATSQSSGNRDPVMEQDLETGTSHTLLDTAGCPGDLQRLTEQTGPGRDLCPSGEHPGGQHSSNLQGGQWVPWTFLPFLNEHPWAASYCAAQ